MKWVKVEIRPLEDIDVAITPDMTITSLKQGLGLEPQQTILLIYSPESGLILREAGNWEKVQGISELGKGGKLVLLDLLVNSPIISHLQET